jgi:hypothetical protein
MVVGASSRQSLISWTQSADLDGGPTEVRLAPNRESLKKIFFTSMVNTAPHIHTVQKLRIHLAAKAMFPSSLHDTGQQAFYAFIFKY